MRKFSPHDLIITFHNVVFCEARKTRPNVSQEVTDFTFTKTNQVNVGAG